MIAHNPHERNLPLSLVLGNFELCGTGSPVTMRGKVIVDWSPQPKLALRFALGRPSVEIARLLDGKLQAQDPSGFLSLDLGEDWMLQYRQDGGTLDASLRRAEHLDKRDPDQVVFHLINFDHLHERNPGGSGYHGLRDISLAGGGWTFALIGSRLNRAKVRAPGYEVTHVGVLSRTDGKPFSKESAANLLDGLRYFLSFARGRWSWPCCYLGVSRGECCWFLAENPKVVDPLTDDHHFSFTSSKDAMVKSFAGFVDIWQKKLWKEPIRAALSWYLDSERALSAETALLSSLTALELVSWLLVVEEREILSADGCNRLPVSDHIRLLLTLLGLPVGFPKHFSAMETYSSEKSRKWGDGPTAITELRNSIVHPRRRNTFFQAPIAVQRQARDLALLYLESALLKIFGFDAEIPGFS
jgi:hypothetical protein